MSDEPDITSATDTPSSNAKPYIRTYAQDFAALSGKKLPDAVSGRKDDSFAPPPPPSPIASIPDLPQRAPTLEEEVDQAVGRESLLNETFNPTRETINLDDFNDKEILTSTPVAPQQVKNSDDERRKILARLKEKAPKPQAETAAQAPVQIPAQQPLEVKPAPVVITEVKPEPTVVSEVKPVPAAPEKPAVIESSPILTKEPERFHSFSTDFKDQVTQQNATPFSVIAAEKDAKTKPVVIQKGRQHTFLPILSGVFLILLAAGGLFVTYRVVTTRNTTINVLAPSLITADKHITLSANADLIGSLSSQVSTSIPDSTIIQDSFSATTTQLSLPAPVVLLRNIDQLSTFGVVNAGGDTHAFFVLHSENYERTFAAMLQWETTMQSNLADLYPLYNPPAQPASQFEDEVIANHNARVLKDANGQTLLVYGYANAQTLIIARNEAAFTLLLNHLSTQS